MTLTATTTTTLAPTTRVVDAVATAAALRDRRRAESTVRGYAASWDRFCAWCAELGADCTTAGPEVVAGFIGDLAAAGLAGATIRTMVAGVAAGFREAGRTDEPCRSDLVAGVLAGVARVSGPARPARAVRTAELVTILASLPTTPRGTRDRALLLLTFGAALRRSELVALDLGDVADMGDRLRLVIRRSKTDQTGQGAHVTVWAGSHPSSCPVAAWRAWLAVRGTEAGPAFCSLVKGGRPTGRRLTGDDVRRALLGAAKGANLDAEGLTAHGLRAGHVTEARARGARNDEIRLVTRHRDERMISHYTRAASADAGSSDRLGL